MKKRFTWTDEAKADLCGIRREQALAILKALNRFATEGTGDIKKLTDDSRARYRFRIGDFRVFFCFEQEDTIHILSVENRSEAYR